MMDFLRYMYLVGLVVLAAWAIGGAMITIYFLARAAIKKAHKK